MYVCGSVCSFIMLVLYFHYARYLCKMKNDYVYCDCSAKALVQKGERRHVFSDTMPAVIQRSINEENLQFMQHRDVYCPEYFDFITALAVTNMVSMQFYMPLCISNFSLYSKLRSTVVILRVVSLAWQACSLLSTSFCTLTSEQERSSGKVLFLNLRLCLFLCLFY